MRNQFDVARDALALALDRERAVTEQVSTLAGVACEEGDYLGEQFAQWFLKGQTGAVALMTTLLWVGERAGDNLSDLEDFVAREVGSVPSRSGAPHAAGGNHEPISRVLRQTSAASSAATETVHSGRGRLKGSVAMDLGALPPEINSGRLHAGPGSGPMLAAAVAWDRLADDLYSTAAGYGWVVSGLTSDGWWGSASAAMAAAAAPYVTWMTTTAALAEQAATQARAVAAAYETAFAMTVPPPVIAANRALFVLLVVTNVVDQNAHAITAAEAHYDEMWAQDATAMYGYAASSAAASTLAPFVPPLQTTNLAGLAGQTAVVDHAAGIHATLSRLMSTVPQALQKLAQPSQPTSPLPTLSTLLGVPARSVMTPMTPLTGTGAVGSAGLARLVASGDAPVVSAGFGRAGSVAGLSVPQGWRTVAMATRPLETVSPSYSVVSDASTDMPRMLSTGTAGYFVGGAAPR